MNWSGRKRSLIRKLIRPRVNRGQVNSEMVDISATRRDW